MKKFVLVMALLFVAGSAHAWRRNGEKSTPVVFDFGDTSTPISIDVGSTTAVLFYSTATAARFLEACDNAGYNVYFATFSTPNQLVSPTWMLPKNLCRNLPVDRPLWAVYESSSGATSRHLTGGYYTDTKD